MQTFKKDGRRWCRGRKINPLLVVRSRISCDRSSPYGYGGAMLRGLRLVDVSLSQFGQDV